MYKSKNVNKKDQALLQLAHYFITVENYTPIVVRGVQNEIWLENLNASYKIIRINANYVHNTEQLDYDFLKIKNVVRQIKKRTLSLNMPTLNILVDVGSNVQMHDSQKINCIKIDTSKGIESSKSLNDLYPSLKNNLVDASDDVEFFINVTNDINKKTEEENVEFERIFSKKQIKVTYFIMAINIILYVLSLINPILLTQLSLNRVYVQSGDFYRLVTSMFMHANLIHIASNMYALYIIGTQVETYLGKKKFLLIYLFSGIIGNLVSCLVNSSWSLGASGAIFGLMGALLYFGFKYRLFLDQALKKQIIPLIIFNLMLGFLITGVDNAAHIGGLIGGIFMTMACGINQKKSDKQDRINGIICSIILLLFLVYMLFGIR